ncbi:hypothetical protein BDB01DRAFT_775845 [Pilobolus umbonatus]|nr:hypothetical protein BDB01DRAFT_775845 [Pilobolus umbonatus]
MATRKTVQHLSTVIRYRRPFNHVIIPKRHYSSKKASMGGIFEPFLDNKITLKEEVVQPTELLSKVSAKDLLPDEAQLQMLIEKGKIQLTIDKQKEITQLVLDSVLNHVDHKDQIWEKADQKPSEVTELANIILSSSQYGAPVALELYKSAMEKGDDRGAFSYANMIYRGYRGTTKDEQQGIKILSELAQKGHPHAQMNLASILMRHHPDRIEAAIKLYELAGRSGIDNAYSELGRMYRLGYGVHQDHKKAMEYFRKGAQTGNPQCNFMLGVYYSSGLGSEEKKPDQEKAFKHFQKAAMKGMAEAQYNVGLRYLKGHGIEANHFNAAEFFRMAALQGFQLAQVNLAAMYSEGRGVKKDMEESRQWLEKAAVKGGTIGKDAAARLKELDEIEGKKKDRCSIM